MSAADGLPRLDPERVVAMTRALAAEQSDAALRAQLHALAALAAQAGAVPPPAAERSAAEADLIAAIAAGDESRALTAGKRLAALDRGAVTAVDWSAVSGG